MNKWYLTIILMLCVVSLAVAMGAAAGSAKKLKTFEGTVTDQNGQALTSVDVVLVRIANVSANNGVACNGPEKDKKALKASTSRLGLYHFSAVRPGLYRVCYSLEGYQSLEKHVQFEQGMQDAILNIQLKSTGDSGLAGHKK